MNTEDLDLTGERLLTSFVNEDTAEHLHRYALSLDHCRGKDVLDIASGEGYGTNLLSKVGANVTGVDISPEAIKHARSKYQNINLRFSQGSASQIPLEDNSVDVVTSFETLEHHDQHQEMFREIKRVLRPDGMLIMSTPDKLYYSDLPGTTNEYHVKELYLEEFRTLVRTFFINVHIYYQDTVLASVLTPEEDGSELIHFQGDHSRISQESRALRKHLYNICIASDKELPKKQNSIFEIPQILASYRGRPLSQELEVSKTALKNAQRELQDLRSSFSFRIGRALTWPLRSFYSR